MIRSGNALERWVTGLSLVAKFFRWWFSELAGLVPRRARLGLRRGGRVLMLDMVGGQVVFRAIAGEKSRELGRIDPAEGDNRAVRRAVRRLIRKAGGARWRVALRLPAENGLRKTLVLPTAAESDLRQALRYQIDRQTPFTQDEVYFDYWIGSRDAEAGRLTVELTVVPKTVLDPALRMAAGWGLNPIIVDVAGDDQGSGPRLNLLADLRRAEPGHGWAPVNVAFAVLALILLGVIVFIPLDHQRVQAERAAGLVVAAKAEAGAVVKQREELERLIKEGRFLDDEKGRTVSVLGILDELTRILPDDSWVFEFNVKDGGIRVSGQSVGASRLIALIDASPLFQTPAFRSPVTQDARTGLERFTLSFALEEAAR